MLLKTLLGAALALPIALASAAQAREGGDAPSAMRHDMPAFSMPALRLPGMALHQDDADLVQIAQAVDPRVAQLEEQVRQLTGTLEELNFQILQMQDQLRRMQEDNELRFQELEERRSDAGGAASPQPPRDHAAADTGNQEVYDALPGVEGGQVLGEPPRDFGTIIFDGNGNVVGGVSEPLDQDRPPADDTTVAALPSGDDADELYRNAYEFILSGDYGTAEAGLRDLIERFPQSEHAADAHFWLGEALLAQNRPHEAAETFLAASRDFPQARRAPDTLFKLGMSLAAMKQRDVACATFSEVGQRYPQASEALVERIRQEQARLSC